MKKILLGFLVLGLFLAIGCIAQEEKAPKEQIEVEVANLSIVPQDGLITVTGNENLSVVNIKAKQSATKWHFPLEEHVDEFIDVGLHSDTFLVLDNSHIKMLDENESIWLIPMVQSGNSAVLFDAVYAKEVSCEDKKTNILGKEYDISKFEDGSGFEFDDKWKIGLEKENDCTKRIVIYLDGYFYDLKDNEQLNLFRNDNTILFKFSNLEDEPLVEVIGTKPTEELSENIIVKDEKGIYLEFSHPIPKTCYGCLNDGLLVEDGKRIKTEINGVEWIVTQLDNNTLEIGLEEQFKTLMEWDNTTTIQTRNKSWYVKTHECHGDFCDQIFTNLDDEQETNRLHSGETEFIDGKYVHVWSSLTWGPFPYQSTVSVLSKRTSINSSETEFVWEGESISSIFIPQSSPMFEKLSGQ